MNDTLTEALIQYIENLPFSRKKALWDLLHTESGETGHSTQKAEWIEKILKLSVWSDSDLMPVQNARNYINQWNPESSF